MGALQAGDMAAAQPLWERYFERLVRLARARLRGGGRLSAEADEEDAVLSAFDSFCAGAARGQFPQLADRDDLWRLLVVITARKVQAQSRRTRRQKRGAGLVSNATDLPGTGEARGSEGLEHVVGNEPTPVFAAQVAEECRRLLEALGDDALRQVALARMEGYTNDEIAERLGCARRTVARRLDLIRKTWLADLPT
jgi:DNA-directed RNA polymerase specialized sigma24 family protein